MLTNAEMIAAVLGAYGAFIMVVPGFFEKYCFCCLMSKKNEVDFLAALNRSSLCCSGVGMSCLDEVTLFIFSLVKISLLK